MLHVRHDDVDVEVCQTGHDWNSMLYVRPGGLVVDPCHASCNGLLFLVVRLVSSMNKHQHVLHSKIGGTEWCENFTDVGGRCNENMYEDNGRHHLA